MKMNIIQYDVEIKKQLSIVVTRSSFLIVIVVVGQTVGSIYIKTLAYGCLCTQNYYALHQWLLPVY